MNNKKKIFRNLIIFILLITFTFYIILKDQNILDILSILVNVKIQYVFIAILCMCLYFVGETINIGRTLKILNEKSSFGRNVKYTLIGFFFSSITPAASGGQPMEIYYMHKDKISVANSTLALLINLCSFQIITISFALISIIFNFNLLNQSLMWFFVLGITLNSMALALLLIGIFSKKLSEALIKFAIKILKFFKYRKVEKVQEKLENEVKQYQGSANYIKSNKEVIVKTLITTLVQVLIYYSIPYWVYLAFGLSESNIFRIITMQAVLYATVSGIPLPGAVGITEGGFMSIFKPIFAAGIISSAMLLTRGVNFYLFVIISAIIVIISTLKVKKIEKEDMIEE